MTHINTSDGLLLCQRTLSPAKHILRVLLGSLVLSPYYLLKYTVTCVYTFPVGFFFVLCSMLLDPSIVAGDKYNVLQMIVDNFQNVFNYSFTLTLGISLVVMLLDPLHQFLRVLCEHVNSNW